MGSKSLNDAIDDMILIKNFNNLTFNF